MEATPRDDSRRDLRFRVRVVGAEAHDIDGRSALGPGLNELHRRDQPVTIDGRPVIAYADDLVDRPGSAELVRPLFHNVGPVYASPSAQVAHPHSLLAKV